MAWSGVEKPPASIGWLCEWPGRGIEGRGLPQPGLGFAEKDLGTSSARRMQSIILVSILRFGWEGNRGFRDSDFVLFLLSAL